MKKKYHVRGKIAYCVGLTLRGKSMILSGGSKSPGTLEHHLLGIFVCCVEEWLRVRCWAESNSHKLKARRCHGRIRRMSITWITLTSLSFLLTRFQTHVWSPVTSSELPHARPFSFQEVSRVGAPDRNLGAATHLGSRGSVM